MAKDSTGKHRNLASSHPATPEDETQAAEQRRLQDASEDDEVYEALKSFRARRTSKTKA
jgi:hypothetical protein